MVYQCLLFNARTRQYALFYTFRDLAGIRHTALLEATAWDVEAYRACWWTECPKAEIKAYSGVDAYADLPRELVEAGYRCSMRYGTPVADDFIDGRLDAAS